MTQPAAGVRCAANVHRGRTFFDISNLSVRVDQERSSIGYASIRHQHSVSLCRLTSDEVAEEWEGKGSLLCKFTQGRNIVGADSQDLRVSAFKLRDTSLVSRHFLRSATCERGGKECHHHVLLASIIGELDLLALSRWQFKIRSHVADLEVGFRGRGLG